MQYAKLGNTEIEVSKVCVGCMSFGKAGTMHDWALDVQLTPEEIAALEAPYVPHPIVGAINANPPQGVMLLDEKK